VQYWPVSKQGGPASRPIAADDGSLRTATISAIGLILKPATLMSKTAKSNTEVCANGSAVSMLPASATTRCPSSSGDHHPDQGLVLDQKYGRPLHISPSIVRITDNQKLGYGRDKLGRGEGLHD
jgi:hypothetical protein